MVKFSGPKASCQVEIRGGTQDTNVIRDFLKEMFQLLLLLLLLLNLITSNKIIIVEPGGPRRAFFSYSRLGIFIHCKKSIVLTQVKLRGLKPGCSLSLTVPSGDWIFSFLFFLLFFIFLFSHNDSL